MLHLMLTQVYEALDITPDMGVPKEPPNQPHPGDSMCNEIRVLRRSMLTFFVFSLEATSSGGYADGEHIKDTNVFSGANQRGRYDAGLD